MQRQVRETPIGETMEGFDKDGRLYVDCDRLSTVTIPGDEIPSKAFRYGVNCH